MSNPVNNWGGEKGGPGKSFACRLDCQRHLDRGQAFYLSDTDRSNPTVANYYGQYKFDKQAFFSESPERASTANPILDAALLRPIVVNCRAAANQPMLDWLISKKVPQTAKRLGIKMRYLFVSDLGNDSLNHFKSTAEMFSPYMPLIFVANLGRSTTGLELFNSDGFQRLLEQYQAPVIHLGLFDLEMNKVIEGCNPKQKTFDLGGKHGTTRSLAFWVSRRSRAIWKTFMSNWTGPSDSPILRFLNARHPHLKPEKKRKVFDLLQASAIPPTDKIFGWVVETALMRVEVAELKENLAQTDSNLAAHPLALQKSLVTVLDPYLKAAGNSKISSDDLTEELRKAALIDASIAESGWRGIGAALAAIFKHQNLLTVVWALVVLSGFLWLLLAWGLGASDRRILEQNRHVIEECNANHASDKDKNGWYTCRLWQLPMPRK